MCRKKFETVQMFLLIQKASLWFHTKITSLSNIKSSTRYAFTHWNIVCTFFKHSKPTIVNLNFLVSISREFRINLFFSWNSVEEFLYCNISWIWNEKKLFWSVFRSSGKVGKFGKDCLILTVYLLQHYQDKEKVFNDSTISAVNCFLEFWMAILKTPKLKRPFIKS